MRGDAGVWSEVAPCSILKKHSRHRQSDESSRRPHSPCARSPCVQCSLGVSGASDAWYHALTCSTRRTAAEALFLIPLLSSLPVVPLVLLRMSCPPCSCSLGGGLHLRRQVKGRVGIILDSLLSARKKCQKTKRSLLSLVPFAFAPYPFET